MIDPGGLDALGADLGPHRVHQALADFTVAPAGDFSPVADQFDAERSFGDIHAHDCPEYTRG
jgi:hypothetical protein